MIGKFLVIISFSLEPLYLASADVNMCVGTFGGSARVGVSWAFVHPIGTHVEDTWKVIHRTLR